jgi:hypothetical protein
MKVEESWDELIMMLTRELAQSRPLKIFDSVHFLRYK